MLNSQPNSKTNLFSSSKGKKKDYTLLANKEKNQTLCNLKIMEDIVL